MKKYNDLFESWKDVQSEYRMDEPKPERVIYASYSHESYSGNSVVVYMNQGKYYVNHASHCSCHGLEGQWSPIEYETPELLLACLEREYPRPDELIKEMKKNMSEGKEI